MKRYIITYEEKGLHLAYQTDNITEEKCIELIGLGLNVCIVDTQKQMYRINSIGWSKIDNKEHF